MIGQLRKLFVLLLKGAAVAFSLMGCPGKEDFIALEIAVLIVEPDFVDSAPPVVWRRLAMERELCCLVVEFYFIVLVVDF